LDFILEGILSAFGLLFSGDAETFSAIKATLYTSSISILFAIMTGFPIGFILGFYEFRARRTLRLLSDVALAMPTVAIGLILYAFISRNGPFGELGLLFTLKAVMLGQFVLALPIIVSLSAYLLGVASAYAYVFILDAPLLRDIFLGGELRNFITFTPSINFNMLFLIFVFSVIPFLAFVIIPSWRIAIGDMSEAVK